MLETLDSFVLSFEDTKRILLEIDDYMDTIMKLGQSDATNEEFAKTLKKEAKIISKIQRKLSGVRLLTKITFSLLAFSLHGNLIESSTICSE